MKKLYRVIAMLLGILTVMSSLVFVSADTPEEKADIVILVDVSGSMNRNDPATASNGYIRVSNDAMDTFVGLLKDRYVNVTIVPYNEVVYRGFETVNLWDEAGQEKVNGYIKALSTKEEKSRQGFPLKGKISGIKKDGTQYTEQNGTIQCYNDWGDTNIGGALSYALEILNAADKDSKKAVVLFTDGKVDLDYMVSKDATTASAEIAKTSSKALIDAGVNVYSVGLNKNGQSVDRAFLEEISSEGHVYETADLKELEKIFKDVLANYLFPGTNPPEVIEGENIKVAPDKESFGEIEIYGGVVEEADVLLESTGKIHSVRVIAPNGEEVASRDIVNSGNVVNKDDVCRISTNAFGDKVTIKLFEPMDGAWKFAIKGEKDSWVTPGELIFYKVQLKDNLGEVNAPIYFGDEFSYDVHITSIKDGSRVANSGLYSADEGARASVLVTNNATGEQVEFPGIGAPANDGDKELGEFRFPVRFSAPGEYTIEAIIKHSRVVMNEEYTDFEERKTATVKAIGPSLSFEAEGTNTDGTVNLVASFKHPATGETVSNLPRYMESGALTVEVCDSKGQIVETIEKKLSEADGARLVCVYTPESAGVYTSNATLTVGDSVSRAEAKPFEVKGFALSCKPGTEKDGIVDFEIGLVNNEKGTLTEEIPAGFEDGKYVVTVKKGNETVETKSLELKPTQKYSLELKKSGEYVVTVKIVDGSGAERGDVTPGMSSYKAIGFVPNVEKKEVNEDEKAVFTVKIVPEDGSAVTKLPGYMDGYKCRLRVFDATNKPEAELFEKVSAEPITFETDVLMAGKYTAEIALVDTEGKLYNSNGLEPMSFEVKASVIEAKDAIKEISERASKGEWEKSVDLSKMFIDSDKDELTYEAELLAEDSCFEVSMDGSKLVVKSTGFTKDNPIDVKITVADGKGAVKEHTISLVSNDPGDLIATILIIVAIVIVLAIIAVIVIRKKSIISMPFKFRVQDSQAREAVYSVSRYSSRRNAQPVVTLKKLVGINNLVSRDSGTLGESEVDNFIKLYGDKISLRGVPFKKAFKVIYKDTDKKKNRTETFKRSMVTLRFETSSGEKYSLSFFK